MYIYILAHLEYVEKQFLSSMSEFPKSFLFRGPIFLKTINHRDPIHNSGVQSKTCFLFKFFFYAHAVQVVL